MEKKKIIVVGIDDFNRYELTRIKNQDQYEFIPLFDPKEIQNQEEIDVENIIQTISKTIHDHNNEIDGIITFFDFPFTLVTFYIAGIHHLRAPTLISGLKCEHKYWCRVEQQEVVPDHVPQFDAVDTLDGKSINEIQVKPPFWIKPVKTHSSQLGFKIKNASDFKKSMAEFKQRIHHFAKPFNYMFYKENLPPEIKNIDGFHCVAEELLEGHQCTLSGYVYKNEVYSYGIVDSLYYDTAPSFLCYLLPSSLPGNVQDKMHDIAVSVMKHIGFNDSPFNIEFFYNKEKNEIKILEINPRMSQSHGYIYSKVKGYSNHEVLVKLATGEKPDFVANKGQYAFAAKFQYRIFNNGKVKAMPSENEVAYLQEQFPTSNIQMKVKKGDVLSDLRINDAYSYCVGEILLAAQSKEKLFDKYNQIKEKLNIEIEKIS